MGCFTTLQERVTAYHGRLERMYGTTSEDFYAGVLSTFLYRGDSTSAEIVFQDISRKAKNDTYFDIGRVTDLIFHAASTIPVHTKNSAKELATDYANRLSQLNTKRQNYIPPKTANGMIIH